MLFFNAFTKLQASLYSAITALAMAVEPATPPADALEDIVLLEEGDASDPELDFTDEGDPAARDREWRCFRDSDRESRGNCLVRCDDEWDDDDDDDYRAVTSKIRIRGNRDYCQRRARKHCNRQGDRLEKWCFGERDRDDDDDDNNNHHHNHH